MTFEGHNIIIIVPLDPSKGPQCTKPIRQEEELREVDDLYKMTTMKDDYIDPTVDGTLSWCYPSSCTSNSDQGMENWQNRMHEVSGRRCVQLTKSLRWIGLEVSQIPTFSGFSQVKEFLVENEIQVPSFQRLKALDVALRATPEKMVGYAQEKHRHMGNLLEITDDQVW